MGEGDELSLALRWLGWGQVIYLSASFLRTEIRILFWSHDIEIMTR